MPLGVPTRRKFVGLAMWTALVSSYGTAVAYALRYLYPTKQTDRWRSIFVARENELVDGEAHVVADLKGTPVQVVRDGKELRALSTVCPHLGCRVRWERDHFLCPCHMGVFDREGKVVSGPPPRPLDRYELEVKDGAVYLRVKEPA